MPRARNNDDHQSSLKSLDRLQAMQLRIRRRQQQAVLRILEGEADLDLKAMSELRDHLKEIESYIASVAPTMIKVQDKIESSREMLTDDALRDQFMAELRRCVLMMTPDEWRELCLIRGEKCAV